MTRFLKRTWNMTKWNRDNRELAELPDGLESLFDDRGHLVFFGKKPSGAGKAEYLEIDWAAQSARLTTRTSVLCDDDDFLDFVEHHVAEIRRKAENSAAGAFAECSFCQKGQNEVARIIAGPKVYICDECVRLCHSILDE